MATPTGPFSDDEDNSLPQSQPQQMDLPPPYNGIMCNYCEAVYARRAPGLSDVERDLFVMDVSFSLSVLLKIFNIIYYFSAFPTSTPRHSVWRGWVDQHRNQQRLHLPPRSRNLPTSSSSSSKSGRSVLFGCKPLQQRATEFSD